MRVAERMQRHRRHPRRLYRNRPFLGEGIRTARLAVPSGEYQRIGWRFADAELEPQFLLRAPMLAQDCDGRRRQADRTSSVFGLGRLEAQTGLGLLERLLDTQHRTIKIDIAPTQREKLAAPHSGRQRRDQDRVNAAAFQLGEHGLRLRGREQFDFSCGHPRWTYQGGDVLVHQTPAMGVTECAPQDTVHMPNCAWRKRGRSAQQESVKLIDMDRPQFLQLQPAFEIANGESRAKTAPACWVCLAGAGSGRTLLHSQPPGQNT